jgi:hypothetical protein
MRHIALLGFDGPCNGLVTYVPASPQKDAGERPHRSLPIFGAKPMEPPQGEWVCDRCGQRWSLEPLPQEVL